jgi:valyl-tRNA synthetase
MSQENAGGELKEELVKEFKQLSKDVTQDMENFYFYIAAEKIYHYIWHRFADEIIEESKSSELGKVKSEYVPTLYYLLENSLKLLHPFMPFVTEEIWQSLHKGKSLLIVESWPTKNES